MIPFSAQFRRYPAEIVASLGRVERARASVEAAPILPAQEDELRQVARAGTIHYSTLIEGNELPLIEAERAVRGELDPTTRAKRELVNYVEALDLLERRHADGRLEYRPELLLALHKATTRSLGILGTGFEPRHEGAFRDGVAVVADPLGNVFHTGPPAGEVEDRVEGLCRWLEERREREEYPVPILAGVAHYGLTDIHPFADGNGRTARLFALGVLYREGYLARRLFSPERYYAEDREAYYAALRSVRRNTLNMEEWLAYFTRGLALEYERTVARVEELAQLALRLPRQLQLTRSQERLLAALSASEAGSITRREAERITGLGRSQAAGTLAELVAAGILEAVGKGPARRYRLESTPGRRRRRAPTSPAPGRRGPERTWTEERIRAELERFLAGRESWPSHREFREAGFLGLYQAASRAGGLARWRKEVLPPRGGPPIPDDAGSQLTLVPDDDA